jgi:hypothetical protein
MSARLPAERNPREDHESQPPSTPTPSSLLYLAPNRWHGSRQRTQHLAEGLAASRPVTFVEPAAYSLPGKLLRESAGNAESPWRARRTELGDNLSLFTPAATMPLSLHLRSVNRFIHGLVARQLERLAPRVLTEATDIIVGWPPALDLAIRLRPRRLIYDCLDLFPAFYNGSRSRLMNTLEAELAHAASAVVVTSGRLEERWSRRHPRVVRIPNGVELGKFLNDSGPLPVPDDVRAHRRPRLGYIGTVGPWLDFPLLTHLARRRPQCSIVLIGPRERGVPRSFDLGNLHLLGERPYASLPRYLAALDVLLIPFRISDLTHAVNPIKLYEYCATGKPIVATPLAELQENRHLFHLGHGGEGFVAAVDAALAEVAASDPSLTRARQTLAKASSWGRRVADLEELLDQLP